MKKYVDKKNSSGNYIFNLNDTYNKIKLAANINLLAHYAKGTLLL